MEIPSAQWTEESSSQGRQEETHSELEYKQIVRIYHLYTYFSFLTSLNFTALIRTATPIHLIQQMI